MGKKSHGKSTGSRAIVIITLTILSDLNHMLGLDQTEKYEISCEEIKSNVTDRALSC